MSGTVEELEAGNEAPLSEEGSSVRISPELELPTEEDLLLAAAYVYDAQYNRNIPFETSPQAIRFYYLYNHWSMQIATYFFIFLDLSLALFEEPAVYPLPFLATSLVEVLCLCTFFGRLVQFAKVTSRTVFWKDTKNICILLTILLTLLDIIIYGTLRVFNIHSVRWSRCLRPLFLINFPESRQIRRAFRSIRNTLPEVLYVFLLLIFNVLMFSLMALKLFGDRNLKTVEGASYFTNILDIMFDLYVLVTTANSPYVMMPAYNLDWRYSLFFITYIVINTYIFMSVFLAVVYNNYRKHLKGFLLETSWIFFHFHFFSFAEMRPKLSVICYSQSFKVSAFPRAYMYLMQNEIRKLAYMKRHKMIKAFNILKTQEGPEFVVKEAHWKHLVKMVAPDISNSHRELLLRISDEEQKGYVDKKCFLRLADLLNIQVITMKFKRHPLEIWMPHVYKSSGSLFIQKIVQHRVFVWIYDVIILINAVFIALDEKNPFISYAEWVFLTLYIIEILLKLYTYEPKTFFARNQFWNWFDTLIIIAALMATIANTAIKSAIEYNSQQILDIIFILRLLRLIRIVDSIQRFRVILTTLINIIPTMLTFGGLVLVVYYMFAIIGMELFKDKVQFFSESSTDTHALDCGNPALKDSTFARSRYCKNNFNDLASSFIVLMELTVVNQWHVIAGGFALVTHEATKLFFIAFHIVVVILIVNIFVAFILEAFFVEYSLEKSEIETTIEKKIQELGMGIQEEDVPDGQLIDNMETNENDLSGGEEMQKQSSKGLFFRIASKRYRTVDALLQRMFESEISPEDEGPSLDEILNLSPSDMYPKNPTFENSA
ncbi:two pore calcium channel protein 1A-like isoform X1 [Sarcophilus harrisii]|uniref:Ion transport domain-containing protein n=1 Tax=Sarcophilus harrisii TaxID=9305 RepID=A0A7N4PXU3_SARHA|nr:two pore calcium channel protein 1A-like isoform X1 [Sarcophilus harrisii]